MKVLLVGSGGREHALAWQLAQSERCDALYCAPGNAGIESCADCVPIGVDDADALVAFAQDKAIDLVVVGPEAPLVAGLADRMRAAGITVFGPSAAAARLEGSKAYMKDLCMRCGAPTAAYNRFTDLAAARAFIAQHGAPLVVKADGLAAGKGVIIAQTAEEAEQAAESMLSGTAFGEAGQEIVIEEFLDGEEISFFALADGKTVLPLTSAQDHKRAFDGDTGPNTGGMGAYSPARGMNEGLGRKIVDDLIAPVAAAMAAEGTPFTGVLFAGIMLVKGKPVLLEFNVRFGDPETQALMARLDSDLLDILLACAQGRLDSVQDRIFWREESALCVVMATQGYPGPYEKDTPLDLNDSENIPDVTVFHAATRRDEAGGLRSTGGRVLGVTGLGPTVAAARDAAYAAVDAIVWPQGFCRRDIGWRALEDGPENCKTSSTGC